MSKPPTIPSAVWEGCFTLFGVEIWCCVLDDGTRIIEQESFEAFMRALANPPGPLDRQELDRFVAWRNGDSQ